MKPATLISSVALMSLFATVACAPQSASVEPSPSVAIEDAGVNDTTEGETPSAPDAVAEPEIQIMGEFVSGEHPTAGTAVLTVDGDARYIEFSDQFQTDAGPDLFVVLHQSPDVIGTSEPPSYSFQEDEYVLIAPLQAVSGSQRYEIPADIDLSQYASVAIWCRQFNATFGAASLQ